ncbi:hypothetical protein OHW01_18110 [Acinetobacter baumannii]|uniref:hypothetical protein n=1 Tax=Acinetobacter baumannii TaxID=470 RepID=UPI0023404CBA|nr:hypothetical protein [Acinetobacter baumannii]
MTKLPRFIDRSASVPQKQTLSAEDRKKADALNISNASEPEDTKALEAKKQAEQKELDRLDPLKHVPRVGESIQLEENTLPNSKRQRKQHGTNLTIPLYFEELKVIQEAMEQEGESDSINDFIRTQVLAKAESILGEEAFNEIVNFKRNKKKEDKTE